MIMRTLREIAAAGVLFLAILSHNATDASLLSLAEEENVAPGVREAAQRAMVRLIAAQGDVIDDVAIGSYLGGMIDQLVPGNNYHISVARDENINAFAALGGVIVINSGLWLSANSEDELVGVVAHELAHQELKHLERGMEKSEQDTLLGLAAAAAGFLLGDSRMQEALVVSSQAAVMSSMLGHSREFEAEADSIGFDMLVRAGAHPAGMVDFLSKVQQLEEAGGTLPEYLRTHPVSTNRIAMLSNRVDNRPLPARPPSSLEFLLLKQRLAVLTGREDPSLKKALDGASGLSFVSFPKETVAELYGMLLVAANRRDWDGFAKVERVLQSSGVSHPVVYGALAEGMGKAGRYDEAKQQLERGLAAFPGNYPLAAQHAKLLAAHPAADHLEAIRAHQREFGRRVELVRAEATLLASLGDMTRHHLALAEVSLASGDIGGAAKQIRIAKGVGAKDGSAPDPEARREISRGEEKYRFYKEEFERIFSS